jgi:hypothetical protein
MGSKCAWSGGVLHPVKITHNCSLRLGRESEWQSGKSLEIYEFGLRAASCGLASGNPASRESAKPIYFQGLSPYPSNSSPHLWEEVAFFQLASIIVDEAIGEDAAFLRTGAYDFLSKPRMDCREKNRMFEE